MNEETRRIENMTTETNQNNAFSSHIKARISYALAVTFFWLIVGSVVYHFMEKWTWIDSFYFATMTLTTVGYGDKLPTTDLSKIFTIFYVLIGVSVMFYTITLAGTYYVEKRVQNRVHERIVTELDPQTHLKRVREYRFKK